MAMTMGMVNGGSSSTSSSWINEHSGGSLKKRNKNKKMNVSCSYSSVATESLKDPYRTLRINPGASEKEVKKAFRQLALQYHPDVCKGNNCGVQFSRINEAYDVVMSNLRGESDGVGLYESFNQNSGGDCDDDSMRGMFDPDYDLWEEWMGWEGAGIRDYSSHINPYI